MSLSTTARGAAPRARDTRALLTLALTLSPSLTLTLTPTLSLTLTLTLTLTVTRCHHLLLWLLPAALLLGAISAISARSRQLGAISAISPRSRRGSSAARSKRDVRVRTLTLTLALT